MEKKIYKIEVAIEAGDETYAADELNSLGYLTEEEAKRIEFHYDDFNSFAKACRKIPYINVEYTLFGNEPKRVCDWLDKWIINKKHFESATIIYTPEPIQASINTLMERLSAEDFAEWWKDHAGFIECPFTKK